MHIFPGHTAVASLYLSTDRAVDPALLAAARKIDAAAFAKAERHAATKPGRIRLRKHIAVALMAQLIISIAASQGCITLEDFRRLGLSDQQIEEYKADAYGEAIAIRPGLIGLLERAA